jgi:glycosyltransferase involved in cell wall biosynthesis
VRICYSIHHDLNLNAGAPGATHELSAAVNDLGHESSIFSFDDLPPSLGERAKAAAFPWFVRRHVRRLQQLDVLDSSEGDSWSWSLKRPQLRPASVVRSHGLEHVAYAEYMVSVRSGVANRSWKHRLYRRSIRLREVRRSLRSADAVCVLNRGDREYVTDKLSLDPKRVRLYRHGLPRSLLGRSLPPLSSKAHLGIAQIGSYIEGKGIRYSSPALNRLLFANPKLTLGLFGTGRPDGAVLADFHPSLHDRIAVVRSYRRERLPALLEGFHIHVLASLSEGLGIAVLEAMACGLVPVVTAIPGPLEIVDDERNGVVVPVRSSSAIEAAITSLAADDERRNRMRYEAHRTAQGYTWQAAAVEAVRLYEGLLADRARIARSS